MVIHDGYLAPVFSMLSEIHNANFIGFWLKEFVRLGGSIPNEFVVDMSKALLNAAVNAFTSHLNLKSYIGALFSKCSDNTNKAPECFIRIDIAHLMKAVADCKHFVNKKPRVRETYLRCIGLIVQQKDLNEIRKIIYSMLVMAYSETEGIYKTIHISIRKIKQKFLVYTLYAIHATATKKHCTLRKQIGRFYFSFRFMLFVSTLFW